MKVGDVNGCIKTIWVMFRVSNRLKRENVKWDVVSLVNPRNK